MGTEVLPAQDYWIHLIKVAPVVFHSRRITTNPRLTNNNRYRKSHARRCCRKPRASAFKRSASAPELTDKHRNKKQRLRVRSLDCIGSKPGASYNDLSMGKRSPGTVSSPANAPVSPDDSYAGSAFFLSPSPRCLPLPSFCNKKQDSITADDNFDDSATKDLRRLLRLE